MYDLKSRDLPLQWKLWHLRLCFGFSCYPVFSYLIHVTVCVCVLVAQSCLTLWDPLDCSPPGSSVHGMLQARTLEWVAMPFSRGSSRPRDRTRVSRIAGGFFTLWAAWEALRIFISWTSVPLQPHFPQPPPVLNLFLQPLTHPAMSSEAGLGLLTARSQERVSPLPLAHPPLMAPKICSVSLTIFHTATFCLLVWGCDTFESALLKKELFF